jgi:hypothetical protein
MTAKRQDDRQGILRNYGEPKLGCERAADQLWIFDGRKIKKLNRPSEFGKHLVSDC